MSKCGLQLVTMTSLGFLPQTLALYGTLADHAAEVSVKILCMDAPSEAYLRSRELTGVTLTSIDELERRDPELAATRMKRTWTEWCWTATPAFCAAALGDAPAGSVLLWVDADIAFHRDPVILLGDLGDGSVLLTPHTYCRPYPVAMPAAGLTELYGRFNGGTIAFRNDDEGRAVSALWRARTLAWCHNACEPGRFGNQLHLDDLPERFARVRAVGVPGGVIGPWNASSLTLRRGPRGPTADGRPVVAYHHQSLRLRRRAPGWRSRVDPNVFALLGLDPAIEARVEPHYRLTAADKHVFWREHVQRLAAAVRTVLEEEPRFWATLPGPLGAGEGRDAFDEQLELRRSLLPEPRRSLRRAWRLLGG